MSIEDASNHLTNKNVAYMCLFLQFNHKHTVSHTLNELLLNNYFFNKNRAHALKDTQPQITWLE